MKSKKKLLIAMAAMSVAAIGAGTVSTFAWFTAAATAKLGTATGSSEALTVTHTNYSAGELTVPITVTVTSHDSMNSLLLARYAQTDENRNTTYKNLTSGYIDQNGVGIFHEIAPATAVNGTTFTGKTKLWSYLTVSVQVDFNAILDDKDNADPNDDDLYWTSTAGSRTFTDGTNTYTELEVMQQLAKTSAKFEISIPGEGSSVRGRLFTENAVENDPRLAVGASAAVLSGNDKTAGVDANGEYYTLAASQSLTGICGITWDGESLGGSLNEANNNINCATTINYYIYGGSASTYDAGTVAHTFIGKVTGV